MFFAQAARPDISALFSAPGPDDYDCDRCTVLEFAVGVRLVYLGDDADLVWTLVRTALLEGKEISIRYE